MRRTNDEIAKDKIKWFSRGVENWNNRKYNLVQIL